MPLDLGRGQFVKGVAVVAVAAVAVLGVKDPAAAQAFDLRIGTGNDQPAVFDFDGGHHPCLYGYYGPPVPPFSDASTPLLLAGGPSKWRDFVALRFSPIVGTCERGESDPKNHADASTIHRLRRP